MRGSRFRIMDAAMETYDAVDFALWPIAAPRGFLALAGQWAHHHAPMLAPALITKLGEDLDIGTALDEFRR
ncbi:hypothetical protein [Peterkaempfera bronchialis]|uniref:hypothetical protein n=1 Tax=Peterkaempfera bronchialis TaxID=2126346 RepID=UPI003C2EAA48